MKWSLSHSKVELDSRVCTIEDIGKIEFDKGKLNICATKTGLYMKGLHHEKNKNVD